MTEKRTRRTFSEEQKKQLVELFNHGKPRSEIIREYDLTASAFDKWVKRINVTGSSREKDNRTIEEQELIKLRKENQQLRMENDVLKQCTIAQSARKLMEVFSDAAHRVLTTSFTRRTHSQEQCGNR